MRIAQIAPLFESVPPALYGGTERVVADLTDELVRLGHDVTLFASGDSTTDAELVTVSPRALRLDTNCLDQLAWHILEIERVAAEADRFDVLHFHIGHIHFPITRRLDVPSVSTAHGRLDLPELAALFAEFADQPLVSISDAQRGPVAEANWIATIHHGLPERRFTFYEEPGTYLAFLGRISPEKRVDRAITIATTLGWPLKIAAKVDRADRDYFEQEIRPLLNHPLVDYIGEIGETEKSAFLGRARALLFPIDWPEPFGLVMIESLACGTPVIAFRGGSVDEVIDHGRTGYVVKSIDEAVAATRAALSLDRRLCRATFERRFSAHRMALDYLNVYSTVVARRADHAAA